ncbi:MULTISPECIES: hypothetical protein [unclassified Sphingobacterium]|uniref:hypothetical protein n=1 Tax=unclassified Sphingobacterium TaxID=2609468 RepID=UPI0020C2DDFA|nr:MULTISPECIES: hypothetical protein [unclassified Sphingobacterium]
MDTIDFDFKTSGYELTGEPEDEFLYNGKSYGCIAGCPAIKIPEDKPVEFKNSMVYIDSAYHAPYTCKWKIENGKLYLIGLNGTIVNSCSDKPNDIDDYKSIDLNYLYPEHKEVFVDWYSGKISLVSGFYEIIRYSKDGKRVFPKVLQLSFESGKLIKEEMEYTAVPIRDKIFEFMKILSVPLVLIFMIIYLPFDWLYGKLKIIIIKYL